MRPEYIEAVAAAQSSVLGWCTFLAPGIVVWAIGVSSFLFRPKARLWVCLSGYALGVMLFWPLSVCHIYQVQAAKEAHMQTEEEMMDFASDVGVTFAPLVQPIVGVVYCGLHFSVVAGIVLVAALLEGTKRRDAELMQ